MNKYATQILFILIKENIFENINFKIPKYKHTVITGPNGSGSIFRVVTSFLYGEITLSSSNIGYVGVTPLILDDTLRALRK